MVEPTITCPKCKSEIKLTESLAAPILESARKDYERKLAQKDLAVASREKAIQEREEALSKERETFESQVAARLQQERGKIAAEEGKKAKLALSTDLEQKAREIADLQDILRKKDEKLTEAQRIQAESLKKQRELDDARRELDLTVEKRVQENLAAARQQARKDAEDELKLKVSEKELTISSMQKQIEELKRKAEQGSQQLQGEVQELQLETLLKSKFPHDTIEPVPKGEFGGDTLHRVVTPLGQPCGTILWESKRTKNWSDAWLPKLRDDQRAAKAEVAILVTQALPKGVETFGQIDTVWIANPQCAFPAALALRHGLVEAAMARTASEGQQTKMGMVYQYFTSARFRQRVQGIVEAFCSMKEDLDKEKKAISKQWAKREAQIECVMRSTVGMYGDLQGIAGKTIQEIEGLDLMAVEISNENLLKDKQP